MASFGMDGIFGLLIRVDSVLLLERCLAGHVIQSVCSQVDIVANVTGICDAHALILIPGRAVLYGQFDAAEYANRVGGIGGNCLTLFYKVAFNGKNVVLIYISGRQFEIVVGYRQIVDVHIEIFIKPECYRHLCLRTYALRKLKQQVPRGNICNIAAGNHGKQGLQLFGYLNRHHIQAKHIGNVHRQLRVDNMVAIHRIITAGEIFRISNGSCPCKGSIAACSVIKVKNGLICAVHGNLHTCADRIILSNLCSNRYVFQPGFLIAGKIEPVIYGFNRTRRSFAQIEFDIARGNGNGVFVISSNQRKPHGIAIYGIDA